MIVRLLKRLRNWFFRTSTPGLNGLDEKLSKYLDFRNGYFIEAGANDGFSQSNTFFLERKRGWRGVLVEGIPELYLKCLEERRRSIVVNCALVSDDYLDATVVMHYANLMSVVDGSLKTEAEQKRHLQAGVEVQRLSGSYSVEVVARTLESILDGIPDIPRIDFLSLDVEGYELSVLKGLNLARYVPKFILVEARFFNEVDEYLCAFGYELVDQLSVHDYLYRHRSWN